MLVSTCTDEERHRPRGHILCRELAKHALHRYLALGLGKVEETTNPLVLRDFGKQFLDVGHANPRQHGAPIGRGKRQIAHGSGTFLEECLVSGAVHERVKSNAFGDLQLEEPSLVLGVLVDERRPVDDIAVDLHHLAGDG